MHFSILGALSVRVDGHAVDLGGRKCRSVLAVLLLNAGRVVSMDELIDAVWGADAVAGARKTLQVYVSQLRATLETDRAKPRRLHTSAPGYAFHPVDGDTIDSLLFDRLTERAQAAAADGDQGSAARGYGEALDLWRGEVVADLFREPFWSSVAPVWQERRLAAVEEWLDARLALGEHGAVLDRIAAEASANPFRERLTGQWMVALYRAGRQQEALAVYRRTAALFSEELGVDPGRALAALHTAILRQDPHLDAPTRPVESARPAHEPSCGPTADPPLEFGTVLVWRGECVCAPGASLDLVDRARLLQAWRERVCSIAASRAQVLDAQTVLVRLTGRRHADLARALRARAQEAVTPQVGPVSVWQRCATELGWLAPRAIPDATLEPATARAVAVAAGCLDPHEPGETVSVGVGTDLARHPFGARTMRRSELTRIAGELRTLSRTQREVLEYACLLGHADQAERADLARLAGADPAADLRALAATPFGPVVAAPDAHPDAVAVILAGMADHRRIRLTRQAALTLGVTGRRIERVAELLEAAVLVEAATHRRPDAEQAVLASEELSRLGWERCSGGAGSAGAALLARAVVQGLLGRPHDDVVQVAAEAVGFGSRAAHADQLIARFTARTGAEHPQPFVPRPWLAITVVDAVEVRIAAAIEGWSPGDTARGKLALAALAGAHSAVPDVNELGSEPLAGATAAWRGLLSRVCSRRDESRPTVPGERLIFASDS